MAKVKSVNSSSSIYVNNSFPELKFGLENFADCSSKCDFDISSFLRDNETHREEQNIGNDNKNGRSSPLTSLKTESLKTSLRSSAENHLKKNKMLAELSFVGDFSLSELLCNNDCPNNSKSISACKSDNLLDFLLAEDDNPNFGKISAAKNDNLFDFLLTEDDNPNVCKTSSAKNDVSFDDLSQWINSSITQTSEPFKLLHADHPSCSGTEGKLENLSPVSLQTETKDIDMSEITNKVSNVDFVNLLKDMSISSLGTIDSSETNCKNPELTDEIFDNDIFPDIDLTFCIKKNSKNDSSFYENSPKTVDSGFDESDFVPDKLSSPSEKEFFYKDILISPNGTGNKNINRCKVKQSLFSKAISAKPKVDISRKLKLRNVMEELLQGSMPLLNCEQHLNLKENRRRTIDLTNEHVIISSYLKFGDEK